MPLIGESRNCVASWTGGRRPWRPRAASLKTKRCGVVCGAVVFGLGLIRSRLARAPVFAQAWPLVRRLRLSARPQTGRARPRRVRRHAGALQNEALALAAPDCKSKLFPLRHRVGRFAERCLAPVSTLLPALASHDTDDTKSPACDIVKIQPLAILFALGSVSAANGEPQMRKALTALIAIVALAFAAVSYTHLTLPTILRV